MTASAHRSEWLEGLMQAAHGPGGARLAVIGSWIDDLPYWAGLRYPPVRTLLEAVLRCLLAAHYDRIVVITGAQRERLPKNWQLGAKLFVGTEPAIWVARGAGREAASGTSAKHPWESVDIGLTTSVFAKVLLWTGGGEHYLERLAKYGRSAAEEIGIAREQKRRAALVVDGGFFHPPSDWDAVKSVAIEDRQADIAERALSEPNNTGTPLDLFLITEDATDTHLVSGAKSFLEELRLHNGHQRGSSLPHLTLGRGFDIRRAQRLATPFPSGFMVMKHSPDLYHGLLDAELDPRPARLERPDRSEQIALEFWAHLDLGALKQGFEDEIIGQPDVKNGILQALEQHKKRCADLIDKEPAAIRNLENPNFFPPVFGFFGAAGMGKTTFCNVIARRLMADQSFVQLIDLAGRDLGGQTIGVAPPGAGYDQLPALVHYAQRTGGIGVVCFDEFTRVQLFRQDLADALGPLLKVVEGRTLIPANETFRPKDGKGELYLANTIFTFAGNVVAADQPCPDGFTHVGELGPAFSQRVKHLYYFAPLGPQDLNLAVEMSLRFSARLYAFDMEREQVELTKRATVTAELKNAVIARFHERVGIDPPSLRVLRMITDEFKFKPAFDSLSKGHDQLVLDVDILGGRP